MKLITLFAIWTCLIAFSAEVSAQCAIQPTCYELGYTLTSTGSCVGTVLKCPFDKSKYYCTQKSEVLNQIKPNWARRISLSNRTTTFYAPSDGMIMGSLEDITNIGSRFNVNGNTLALTGQPQQRSFFFAILKSGDSVYIKGNDINGYFVPFSGN